MPDLKEDLRQLQAQGETSLKDTLASFQKERKEAGGMTGAEAARVSFFDRSINSLFNLPAAAGELTGQAIAGTAAGIEAPFLAMRNAFRGEEAGMGGEFLEKREEMLERQPVRAFRNLPRPPENLGEQFRALASAADPTEIGAPGRAAFGDRLAQAREEEARRTEQAAELFPGMTTVGETASDVGTLLMARVPASRARAPGQAARRTVIIDQAKKSLDDLPPSISGRVNDAFTDRVIPFFKETGERSRRGLGKALETGLEGALFAAINEGDLESSFGLAAGAQGAGSLSLFLVEKPAKRLLPAVGIAWVASEMMKAAGPGDQDFFASKDFAIQKMVAVMGAGAVAAMAGAGRFRGPIAERFPVFMDAITAIPRGALVSRMAEMTKAAEEGDDSPLQVMQRFASNPAVFSDDQQNALMRALRSEKKGAFTAEVRRLMDNADFVRRLGSAQSTSLSPTFPIQRRQGVGLQEPTSVRLDGRDVPFINTRGN